MVRKYASKKRYYKKTYKRSYYKKLNRKVNTLLSKVDGEIKKVD